MKQIAWLIAFMIPWAIVGAMAKKRQKKGLLDLAWVMGGIAGLLLVFALIGVVVKWSEAVGV
jgi:hypothetical protein